MTSPDPSPRSFASVIHAIAESAQADPGKPAAKCRGRVLSYGELLAEADGAAGRVAHSDAFPVAVAATDPLDQLIYFLGAGRAGGIPAVLNPRWTDAQLIAALEQVRPCARLADTRAATRLAEMPAHFACTAGQDCLVPSSGEGDDLLIGFTSGTSGGPRAYRRDHASWIRSFEIAWDAFPLGRADQVLIPGPLHHSLFLFATLQSLWAGATVHLLDRFSPGAVASALRDAPISQIWAVPTMLHAAASEIDALSGAQRGRVRGVYCSGAPWAQRHFERCCLQFPAAEVVEFYGASELSFVAYRSRDHRAPADRGMRPFPGVDVAIREGLIYARSDLLFSGYVESAPTHFRQDGGWMTVGDTGRLGAGGELHVEGRSDSILNCGGLKLQPEPIEAALEALPGIAEVAVVGQPDPRWGERAVALIRFSPAATPVSRSDLRRHCQKLGLAAKPHQFLGVAALPHTASGKLARAELAKAISEQSLTCWSLP